MPVYVPEKGDFVRLSFDPQVGYEQKGRRPALVISNTLFNIHTQLAMVCPITNTNRNIPFHVRLPFESFLTGYIMVEQIKSLDYSIRDVEYIESAPSWLLEEVLSILDTCLF